MVDNGRIIDSNTIVMIIRKTGFALIKGAIIAINNPRMTKVRLVFDLGLIDELLKSDRSHGAINIVGIKLDIPALTHPIINNAVANRPANGSIVLTMSIASSTGLPMTYKVPAAQIIIAKLNRNIIPTETKMSIKAFFLFSIPQPFALSVMLRQYITAELTVVPTIPAMIRVALGSSGIRGTRPL